MRIKVFAFALVAVFLLTGCATQQVDFKEDLTNKAKPEHKEWQHFFVFGLVPPEQNRKASEFCQQSGLTRVETELTFLNGLAGALTYNLYSPRTLKIYCQ